jgi:hypothetical protein
MENKENHSTALEGEDLEKVEQMVKVGESQPFKLSDKLDTETTAKRFGLSVEDVKDAISGVESGAELKVTVTRRREELQQYLQHLYDSEARKWSFESMAAMMATAHVKIVAHAIVGDSAASGW